MIHHLDQISKVVDSVSKVLPGVFMLGSIDKKYLREYRCPTCRKLLAKGKMSNHDDLLEVKCCGCGTICLFKGEHAEIVETRSRLLKEGIIPDTDS